ncbi:MAG TPA: ATP-binding protein [Allosphingosinicella sp.]|nr:ATP-binding protein [Allosphingosinicella sp.]
MNAEAAIPVASLPPPPRWRRRLRVMRRRGGWIPVIEVGVALLLVATVAISYVLISRRDPGGLLTPPLVATLLVANLVPAMTLMVLFARRVALKRASRTALGMKSRLPVRLVAIFSLIAAVPTLVVTIVVSLLFQYSVEFWFSDRARGMLENATDLAQANYNREFNRVGAEAVTMSVDVSRYLREVSYDNPIFVQALGSQAFERNLSEVILFRVGRGGEIQSLALVNPYERDLERSLTPDVIAQVRREGALKIVRANRFEAVATVPDSNGAYLYVARVFEAELGEQMQRSAQIRQDYQALATRSRDLQLRFNAALLGLSLLIVAVAIWIALKLADRLVRPVGQLVNAARQVTAGDLSTRVPPTGSNDEVATLGDAFNRMTTRLEEQTGALVTANAQLESRRAFTEAVLSGVTAGVVSVDEDHVIRLINVSAEALLKTGGQSPVGQKLADLAPELDRHLTADEQEDVVQLASRGEPRTLAVKTVQVRGGYVLTFDDITEQLLDQRRAAWSDVARRIAHEIKNPLTPIQLAAERLQRRYGKEIESDPATFERLTGTIVRQVGDLRRMVDEFSSFARMPKPAFAAEPLAEIARQALFLHEVAHPEIAFTLAVPDPAPVLVCDRRLLGQALTNIVKNGVEAVEQKKEAGRKPAKGGDRIAMTISTEGSRVIVEVADTGIGLPAERGRLTEPYMTTRAKGTGLGLAIVKKIVEEHFGQIEFADAPGGGSLVRLVFDADTLAQLDRSAPSVSEETTSDS